VRNRLRDNGSVELQETIGERLHRLRRERGLTLRQLGGADVSHAYISRIEAGTRAPSVAVLRTLAARLDVSADLLEHGIEPASRARVEQALADAELGLRLGVEPDVRATLEQVRAEAEQLGDPALLSRANAATGLAASQVGDHESAIVLLEAATAHAAADPVADPDLFVTLGSSYTTLHREDDAIALYERCLRETAGRQAAIAAARIRFGTHLSYALADTGRFREAAVLLDGLAAEPAPDLYSRIRLEWARGRLDLTIGLEEAALERFEAVVVLLGETEDELHRARAELQCADICAMLGDDARAAAHLERAAPVETLDHAVSSGSRRAIQALLAIRRGERAKAAALVRDANELLGASAIGGGLASLATALVRLAEGDIATARRAAARGIAEMERHEGLGRAAAFAGEWADALAAAGHPRSAQTARALGAALLERHLAQLEAFRPATR
jgi:transcriptional regulator with XRE-family HTH domain